MSLLKRNGIPGPEPNLIFGNIFNIGTKSIINKQKYLIEKYGKIVGYYVGYQPIVLVADPLMAKNIFIKDFEYFTDRAPVVNYLFPSYISDGSILKEKGEKWKRIRGLLSPAFTAKKLKEMTPLIKESIDSFLEKLEEMSCKAEEFNICILFERLAADVIIKIAFGCEIDAQNDRENEFLQAAQKFVEIKHNAFVFITYNCFRCLQYIIHPVRCLIEIIGILLNLSPLSTLVTMASKIIEMRKSNPNLRRNDLLQAMLDANLKEKELSYLNEDVNENNNCSNIKFNNEQLTKNHIISNCATIYEAGYETTSSAMAYVTHLLVNHPEIQEKLREEVIELFKRDGYLESNALNELNYMEMVINESLRLYPPVINGCSRECLEDYRYKDMIIPKGTLVACGTYYMHHDKDFWPEPERFNPLRFSTEEKSMINSVSWQPFGIGPRNCIGMRLAYYEMKLTLSNILLRYRFVKGPSTEIGRLKTKLRTLSMVPLKGVFVRVVKI